MYIRSLKSKLEEYRKRCGGYDYANINKGFEKYEIAIEYYTELLKNVDQSSYAISRILYRRGSSYERTGNYEKADRDLIESLKMYPNEPYTLNYLAYSWLERNYKIDEAIDMIQKAHKQNPHKDTQTHRHTDT